MTIEELKTVAASMGYELRRHGVHRPKCLRVDENGHALKTTYLPHLSVNASCYARTWKVLKTAMELWGGEGYSAGDVWEERLLLACEHIVRWVKHEINDDEMQTQIRRLINPLPKAEWLSRNTKNNKKEQ